MLIYHNDHKDDLDQAVKAAIFEAAEIAKSLKTFDVESEPAVKEIEKQGVKMTEVALKATGADRNYAQFSINYLKGEIEGHGNEASDTFSKLWKSQGLPKGDDVSPWIGRKTYPAILEKITGETNDLDHAGSIGLLKGKTYDPADLKNWDAQRQGFEKILQAKAAAIISAVRQQYNATIVLMATMGGKIVYKDLEKDFVSKVAHRHEATKTAKEWDEVVETQTISDKKAELAYINRTLPATRGAIYLYGKLKDLIQASGDLELMKSQAAAMEEAEPLIEGDVKAYEEEQAKAARAAAREDKKADKDKELKANIVKTFELGATVQMICMLTKVSEDKIEEILKEAGLNPANN